MYTCVPRVFVRFVFSGRFSFFAELFYFVVSPDLISFRRHRAFPFPSHSKRAVNGFYVFRFEKHEREARATTTKPTRGTKIRILPK